MVLTITGGFKSRRASRSKVISTPNAYQVGDDLTLVRGRHQIALGGNMAYWTYDQVAHADRAVTGRSTGRPPVSASPTSWWDGVASLEHGGPTNSPVEQWYFGLYAQDSWRASDRVTFNLGLRWEPFFGAGLRNNAISNFDIDNFRKGVQSTVFLNAPAGLVYPGDPGFRRAIPG